VPHWELCLRRPNKGCAKKHAPRCR
jgi:hypothetical protein